MSGTFGTVNVAINLLISYAKHSVVLGKVSTEKTIQSFVGLFSQVRFIPVKRKDCQDCALYRHGVYG